MDLKSCSLERPRTVETETVHGLSAPRDDLDLDEEPPSKTHSDTAWGTSLPRWPLTTGQPLVGHDTDCPKSYYSIQVPEELVKAASSTPPRPSHAPHPRGASGCTISSGLNAIPPAGEGDDSSGPEERRSSSVQDLNTAGGTPRRVAAQQLLWAASPHVPVPPSDPLTSLNSSPRTSGATPSIPLGASSGSSKQQRHDGALLVHVPPPPSPAAAHDTTASERKEEGREEHLAASRRKSKKGKALQSVLELVKAAKAELAEGGIDSSASRVQGHCNSFESATVHVVGHEESCQHPTDVKKAIPEKLPCGSLDTPAGSSAGRTSPSTSSERGITPPPAVKHPPLIPNASDHWSSSGNASLPPGSGLVSEGWHGRSSSTADTESQNQRSHHRTPTPLCTAAASTLTVADLYRDVKAIQKVMEGGEPGSARRTENEAEAAQEDTTHHPMPEIASLSSPVRVTSDSYAKETPPGTAPERLPPSLGSPPSPTVLPEPSPRAPIGSPPLSLLSFIPMPIQGDEHSLGESHMNVSSTSSSPHHEPSSPTFDHISSSAENEKLITSFLAPSQCLSASPCSPIQQRDTVAHLREGQNSILYEAWRKEDTGTAAESRLVNSHAFHSTPQPQLFSFFMTAVSDCEVMPPHTVNERVPATARPVKEDSERNISSATSLPEKMTSVVPTSSHEKSTTQKKVPVLGASGYCDEGELRRVIVKETEEMPCEELETETEDEEPNSSVPAQSTMQNSSMNCMPSHLTSVISPSKEDGTVRHLPEMSLATPFTDDRTTTEMPNNGDPMKHDQVKVHPPEIERVEEDVVGGHKNPEEIRPTRFEDYGNTPHTSPIQPSSSAERPATAVFRGEDLLTLRMRGLPQWQSGIAQQGTQVESSGNYELVDDDSHFTLNFASATRLLLPSPTHGKCNSSGLPGSIPPPPNPVELSATGALLSSGVNSIASEVRTSLTNRLSLDMPSGDPNPKRSGFLAVIPSSPTNAQLGTTGKQEVVYPPSPMSHIPSPPSRETVREGGGDTMSVEKEIDRCAGDDDLPPPEKQAVLKRVLSDISSIRTLLQDDVQRVQQYDDCLQQQRCMEWQRYDATVNRKEREIEDAVRKKAEQREHREERDRVARGVELAQTKAEEPAPSSSPLLFTKQNRSSLVSPMVLPPPLLGFSVPSQGDGAERRISLPSALPYPSRYAQIAAAVAPRGGVTEESSSSPHTGSSPSRILRESGQKSLFFRDNHTSNGSPAPHSRSRRSFLLAGGKASRPPSASPHSTAKALFKAESSCIIVPPPPALLASLLLHQSEENSSLASGTSLQNNSPAIVGRSTAGTPLRADAPGGLRENPNSASPAVVLSALSNSADSYPVGERGKQQSVPTPSRVPPSTPENLQALPKPTYGGQLAGSAVTPHADAIHLGSFEKLSSRSAREHQRPSQNETHSLPHMSAHPRNALQTEPGMSGEAARLLPSEHTSADSLSSTPCGNVIHVPPRRDPSCEEDEKDLRANAYLKTSHSINTVITANVTTLMNPSSAKQLSMLVPFNALNSSDSSIKLSMTSNTAEEQLPQKLERAGSNRVVESHSTVTSKLAAKSRLGTRIHTHLVAGKSDQQFLQESPSLLLSCSSATTTDFTVNASGPQKSFLASSRGGTTTLSSMQRRHSFSPLLGHGVTSCTSRSVSPKSNRPPPRIFSSSGAVEEPVGDGPLSRRASLHTMEEEMVELAPVASGKSGGCISCLSSFGGGQEFLRTTSVGVGLDSISVMHSTAAPSSAHRKTHKNVRSLMDKKMKKIYLKPEDEENTISTTVKNSTTMDRGVVFSDSIPSYSALPRGRDMNCSKHSMASSAPSLAGGLLLPSLTSSAFLNTEEKAERKTLASSDHVLHLLQPRSHSDGIIEVLNTTLTQKSLFPSPVTPFPNDSTVKHHADGDYVRVRRSQSTVEEQLEKDRLWTEEQSLEFPTQQVELRRKKEHRSKFEILSVNGSFIAPQPQKDEEAALPDKEKEVRHRLEELQQREVAEVALQQREAQLREQENVLRERELELHRQAERMLLQFRALQQTEAAQRETEHNATDTLESPSPHTEVERAVSEDPLEASQKTEAKAHSEQQSETAAEKPQSPVVVPPLASVRSGSLLVMKVPPETPFGMHPTGYAQESLHTIASSSSARPQDESNSVRVLGIVSSSTTQLSHGLAYSETASSVYAHNLSDRSHHMEAAALMGSARQRLLLYSSKDSASEEGSTSRPPRAPSPHTAMREEQRPSPGKASLSSLGVKIPALDIPQEDGTSDPASYRIRHSPPLPLVRPPLGKETSLTSASPRLSLPSLCLSSLSSSAALSLPTSSSATTRLK